MAAQSHKHILQVHGGNIHIELLRLGQLGRAAPHAAALVAAGLPGGEHLQALAGPVHLLLVAGDVAELIDQLVGLGVFDDLPLVQDDDPLKDRGGLLDDVGGDNKGAVCLGVVLQEELVEPLPHHPARPPVRPEW